MEWAVQGGDGVTIPRGVQGIIQCYDPVDKAVIGQKLVSMIFSNLNDSVVLWCSNNAALKILIKKPS